jgi:hypothetical protein
VAWERRTRGNADGYFYVSKRVNGRPTKTYIGRGDDADAQAREIEQRRQARTREREARQQSEAEVILAAQKTSELRALTTALVHAVLDGAGYHIHRGEIRRRRCQRS